MGAWAANPARPVVDVTGNGGFGQYFAEGNGEAEHAQADSHLPEHRSHATHWRGLVESYVSPDEYLCLRSPGAHFRSGDPHVRTDEISGVPPGTPNSDSPTSQHSMTALDTTPSATP
jgi:hypothetical protein